MSSPRSGYVLRSGLVVGLAVGVIALVAGCENEPARVTVAVTAGESFLDAATLALEDELAAAAIPGLDTVMVMEGSNRSAPALAIAEGLVEHEGLVAVVGHANSAASLVASQIYNGHGVVQLAPTSTAPSYSEAGPFSFRMVPSDEHQGPYLVEAVRDAFPDGARVAVIYVNDDYGRGLRSAVLTVLDTARYPVVLQLPHAEEAVGPDDVRQGMAAFENASPDVLLWLARPQVLELFLPSLRALDAELPIIGGDAVSRAIVFEDPDSLWQGVTYTDFVDPRSTPEMRAFLDRFQPRFGTEASGPEILTYDAVRLVLQGVREGARTGEALREYLTSLGKERPPFHGLSGPLTFDERGDVQRSFVLRVLGRTDR
jgi:branched-chain amino acid transport system substrate-binding protein